MCEWKALTPRDGLIVEPDQKSYRQFVLRHNPGYENKCDMIQFLELLDWANHAVPEPDRSGNPGHHENPQSRQR